MAFCQQMVVNWPAVHTVLCLQAIKWEKIEQISFVDYASDKCTNVSSNEWTLLLQFISLPFPSMSGVRLALWNSAFAQPQVSTIIKSLVHLVTKEKPGQDFLNPSIYPQPLGETLTLKSRCTRASRILSFATIKSFVRLAFNIKPKDKIMGTDERKMKSTICPHCTVIVS